MARGNGLKIRPQHAAGERLDGDLAAALLRDQIGEFLDTQNLRMALVAGRRELQRPLLDVRRVGGSRQQQHSGDEETGEKPGSERFHGVSSIAVRFLGSGQAAPRSA
jgi:hypothetical protein